MGKFAALWLLVVAIGGGYLAYTGTFYPTGRQYYEVCWQKNDVGKDHASDPYQDVIWTNCDNIAARAIFASGMFAPPEPEDEQDKEGMALKAACPEAPRLASSNVLKGVQASGGPQLIDIITPAEWMIGRVVKTLWPKCDEVRRKQGYPKIVETSPGEFGWEQECGPCKARERRREAREEEACKEAHVEVEDEAKRWKIIAPTKVQLLSPRLEPGGLFPAGRQYDVTGSIKNNAAVPISAVEVNVTLYNCPTQATPLAACDVIGQQSTETFLSENASAETPGVNERDPAPPGQVRRFRGDMYFKDPVAPLGVQSWNVSVSGVRAPIDASDKATADDAAEAFFARAETSEGCK